MAPLIWCSVTLHLARSAQRRIRLLKTSYQHSSKRRTLLETLKVWTFEPNRRWNGEQEFCFAKPELCVVSVYTGPEIRRLKENGFPNEIAGPSNQSDVDDDWERLTSGRWRREVVEFIGNLVVFLFGILIKCQHFSEFSYFMNSALNAFVIINNN